MVLLQCGDVIFERPEADEAIAGIFLPLNDPNRYDCFFNLRRYVTTTSKPYLFFQQDQCHCKQLGIKDVYISF